jgi:hypothetical protein
MCKFATCACIALIVISTSSASVIEFTDRAEWEGAVGTYTTVDFVLPPSPTPITDQYADLGVVFSGAAYSHASMGVFPNDGWGLFGIGGAWAHFDTPQHWIAVDYPGSIQFQLFRKGELVYTSTYFFFPGVGNFAGLVSEVPFDEVFLRRLDSPYNIAIDDLHFGGLVPGPGGMALLALAGFAGRSRRRGPRFDLQERDAL